MSYAEQTGTDSQARTILGDDGVERWAPEMQKEASHEVVEQPEPARVWSRVQRVSTQETRVEKGESSNDGGRAEAEEIETVEPPPRTQSWGRGMGGFTSPQGLKRNVWEVRRKRDSTASS